MQLSMYVPGELVEILKLKHGLGWKGLQRSSTSNYLAMGKDNIREISVQ